MDFQKAQAALFIPDSLAEPSALQRTTHMGIGAHPDDLEFMTWHGILECFQNDGRWFCGVTVCDGRGSSRINEYARYSDDQMEQVRLKEQQRAAVVGEYSAQADLMYSSKEIRNPEGRAALREDLRQLFRAARPEVIYTHNLADRHDTHVAVVTCVVEALRSLPPEYHPQQFYGCEVWRSLDWLPDRVSFNVSAHENLTSALMGVYDSQISGGKRYDLATAGRKRANATYHEAYRPDAATSLEYAMDLAPLLRQPDLSFSAFARAQVEKLAVDVEARVQAYDLPPEARP